MGNVGFLKNGKRHYFGQIATLLCLIIFTLSALVIDQLSELPLNGPLVHLYMVGNIDAHRFGEVSDTLDSLRFFKSECRVLINFVHESNETRTFLDEYFENATDSSMSIRYFKDPPSRLVVPNGFRNVLSIVKVFPDIILPNSVDKAIFIDFDMIFVHDICEYFFEFKKFANNEVIGLSPEYTKWYTGRDSSIYTIPLEMKENFVPPSFRGINGGLLLFDLQAMREFQWTYKIFKLLDTGPVLTLSDQDVFNLMGGLFPNIIHYNPVKMNYQTIMGGCYEYPRDIWAYHGNGGSASIGNTVEIIRILWRQLYNESIINSRSKPKSYYQDIIRTSLRDNCPNLGNTTDSDGLRPEI
jgi:hypothetical protein